MMKIGGRVWTCAAGVAGGILAMALFVPRPAGAVDGQVNINQATVMAAGGFPYHITQPGSYKLAGNLIVPADKDAVEITADGVTLDLNGFSIIGPLTCTGQPVTSCAGSASGTGIYSTNNNIAVKNGTVTGMGLRGVDLEGTNILVEEVRASQNGAGIYAGRGIVRRCLASSNNYNGMVVVNGGILEGNVADFNGNTAYFPTNATVIGNEASQNHTGLFVLGSVFGSNALIQNGSDLVSFSGSVSQNNNVCSGAGC
jgi:hypothetical protein